MVISDIIVVGMSNTYSKVHSIEKAEIIQGTRITDFYCDEYPFLSAYEGVAYQIIPRSRKQCDYDHEFLDMPEDSSLRIIWIERDLKEKILGIIHDMLIETGAPVVFLTHLQGYDQREIPLGFSAFENKMMNESLYFNTAYVITN